MIHIGPVSVVVKMDIWLPEITLSEMNLVLTPVVSGIPGEVVILPGKPHPGIDFNDGPTRIKVCNKGRQESR